MLIGSYVVAGSVVRGSYVVMKSAVKDVVYRLVCGLRLVCRS